MQCNNCGVELKAENSVCPSCQVLITDGLNKTLASPARRLMAFLLDYGVMLFGVFLTALDPVFAFLIILIGFIQLFMLFKSTTLGKSILGMKVYQKDGEPVGFLKMLLREIFGKTISGMIFSLGYIWILIDDENQAWHDKFIDSLVLKT